MSVNLKDISNQVISMDKEYVTREGRKVEILTVSRNHSHSVVFLIDNEYVHCCLPNGKLTTCPEFDLVEVPKIEEGLRKHDLVIVSDEHGEGHLRFFSHYKGGEAFAFHNGDYEVGVSSWKYCRKATPQEIIAKKYALQNACS